MGKEMGYTRFIQNGRICLVNYGPNADKLVTVVDVIDQNRCLVYGPEVARQVLGYKRLSVTDIKLDIGRGAKAKTVDAKWTEADVDGQWAATSWARSLLHASRRLPRTTSIASRRWLHTRRKCSKSVPS